MTQTVVAAAILQNNALLLVRKKLSWILPGGKLNPGETDLECLCREVDEELSGTQIKDVYFYKQFTGRTPHKGNLLQARIYFANIDGKLYSVRESDSISEARWVTAFSTYNLSDVASKIVISLQEDAYLPV